MMVFFLFVFGVSSVREFAMPLMIGIVCGAYSSVCIYRGALVRYEDERQKEYGN